MYFVIALKSSTNLCSRTLWLSPAVGFKPALTESSPFFWPFPEPVGNDLNFHTLFTDSHFASEFLLREILNFLHQHIPYLSHLLTCIIFKSTPPWLGSLLHSTHLAIFRLPSFSSTTAMRPRLSADILLVRTSFDRKTAWYSKSHRYSPFDRRTLLEIGSLAVSDGTILYRRWYIGGRTEWPPYKLQCDLIEYLLCCPYPCTAQEIHEQRPSYCWSGPLV